MNRMMLRFLFCFLSFMCISLCYTQSKKEVKKFKIKTVNTTETDSLKTINDYNVVYDNNGEVIQETTYNKDGTFKATHKYKYNSKGDEIEEFEYDSTNVLKEKKTTKYNALGDKSEELFFDKDQKLFKKNIFAYDGKGLKTIRKTFNGAGKLLITKKYTYTFK